MFLSFKFIKGKNKTKKKRKRKKEKEKGIEHILPLFRKEKFVFENCLQTHCEEGFFHAIAKRKSERGILNYHPSNQKSSHQFERNSLQSPLAQWAKKRNFSTNFGELHRKTIFFLSTPFSFLLFLCFFSCCFFVSLFPNGSNGSNGLEGRRGD